MTIDIERIAREADTRVLRIMCAPDNLRPVINRAAPVWQEQFAALVMEEAADRIEANAKAAPNAQAKCALEWEACRIRDIAASLSGGKDGG